MPEQTFTKEQIKLILQDVEETPGELSIAEFESKQNRAFDRGWRAAITAVQQLLDDTERLRILGIK